MSVRELLDFLRANKIKVTLLVLPLLIVCGPGLYDDWQKKQAQEKFNADRESVDEDASVAGMMLVDAWRSCRDIGIVNDMKRCAAYEGKLLQEKAAPVLAKTAIEYRDAYYTNCYRFYTEEYCHKLLNRSLALSSAQAQGKQ